MTKNIWAIIRVFEKDKKNLEQRIKKIKNIIKNLLLTDIKNIQIVVVKDMDKSWISEVMQEIKIFQDKKIEIIEIKWNQFTKILNIAIKNNYKNLIDYSLILSPEIFESVTQKNIDLLKQSIDKNNIAWTSLLINFWNLDYDTSKISKAQLFVNTFWLWKTKEFLEYWLFWREWIYWVEEFWAIMRLSTKWYKFLIIDTWENINYDYTESSKNFQIEKLKTKHIKLINSYLIYLKNKKIISKQEFENSYDYKKNKKYWTIKNQELRNKFEKEFFEVSDKIISIKKY